MARKHHGFPDPSHKLRAKDNLAITDFATMERGDAACLIIKSEPGMQPPVSALAGLGPRADVPASGGADHALRGTEIPHQVGQLRRRCTLRRSW